MSRRETGRIPSPRSQRQGHVEALKACGSDVQLTLYPEAQHDSWTETYNNPALHDGFLQHQRGAKK